MTEQPTQPTVTWTHDDDLNLEVMTLDIPGLDPIHVAFTPEAMLELGRQIVHREAGLPSDPLTDEQLLLLVADALIARGPDDGSEVDQP